MPYRFEGRILRQNPTLSLAPRVSCNHIPLRLPQQTTSALTTYNNRVTSASYASVIFETFLRSRLGHCGTTAGTAPGRNDLAKTNDQEMVTVNIVMYGFSGEALMSPE